MNTPIELQEAVDAVGTAEVFRKQVCRIAFPTYFAQLERFVADSLVDPQALCINVAQLPKPLASTNAYGRYLFVRTLTGRVMPTSLSSAW